MVHSILQYVGQLFQWWFVVAPWEQAIRVRAGRKVILLGAGIYLKVPYLDRVYRQSVRRRLAIIKSQTLTTQDGQVITLSGSLGYEIVDLMKLFDSLEDPNDTIDSIVAASVAAYVHGQPITQCTPGLIEDHVRGDIDLSKFGLGNQEFYLTNFVGMARTYRVLTDSLRTWQHSDGISMSEHGGGGIHGF